MNTATLPIVNTNTGLFQHKYRHLHETEFWSNTCTITDDHQNLLKYSLSYMIQSSIFSLLLSFYFPQLMELFDCLNSANLVENSLFWILRLSVLTEKLLPLIPKLIASDYYLFSDWPAYWEHRQNQACKFSQLWFALSSRMYLGK